VSHKILQVFNRYLHAGGEEKSVDRIFKHLSERHEVSRCFFDSAAWRQPEAPVSWIARGISRQELGQNQLASQDLNHAAALLDQGGDGKGAQELRKAASAIVKPAAKAPSGNGFGGQLLQGAATLAGALAPLAVKFLVPLAF
jgi:hypothetical protein